MIDSRDGCEQDVAERSDSSRVGIVDLGSNTVRLVVYDLVPGDWFRLVDQIRERVRLGAGLFAENRLQIAAIERAEAVLKLIAQYALSTGLSSLKVLGTSALRDAENRHEFFERMESLDLDVSVLSGSEEARLGALGVANSLEVDDGWVVDLGGGSAQISRIENRVWVGGEAYPLGAVRLTERFLQRDPPRRKEIKKLVRHVRGELAAAVSEIRERGGPIVALGGTVRNLARTVQRAERYPLGDRLHGYFLERRSLEELTETLIGMKTRRRARVPGINSDRADIVVAGAIVFRELLREVDADGLRICGHGLREGALYQQFLPEPHLAPSIRQQSLRNLLSYYAQSKERIERVRRLARQLFRGLALSHGLGHREEDLLDAGAVLQDIGLAVNYYRHDRHGAYLVSAAQLNGFTHREQALLAQLVRYHQKGRPKLGGYRQVCRKDDDRLLLVLVACLRVAEHLERPRARRVTEVRVETRSKGFRIKVIADGPVDLEMHGIDQHGDLLKRAFGRPVVFASEVS